MAGVDVETKGSKRRATNGDINMIPFIDLLMVTIAFLLITAVWVTNSRIATHVDVPGKSECGEKCPKVERAFHVNVAPKEFSLVWKEKGAVVSELHVPRQPVELGQGAMTALTYPDLGRAIEAEWRRMGNADPANPAADQAIVHTDDATTFRELVAVLDALNGTKRDLRQPGGKVARVPAFAMTLAQR